MNHLQWTAIFVVLTTGFTIYHEYYVQVVIPKLERQLTYYPQNSTRIVPIGIDFSYSMWSIGGFLFMSIVLGSAVSMFDHQTNHSSQFKGTLPTCIGRLNIHGTNRGGEFG